MFVVAHEVHAAGGIGLLRQLHLRHRQAGLRGLGAGWHIAGPVEVEDRWRTPRCLAQRRAGTVGVADLEVAGVRCEREGAQASRQAQRRFAQLARGARLGACLRVQQHRLDHGLHVAACAATAAEGCRHGRHIGRARVAGDQPLDQLPADERAHIGMAEQRVERRLQARIRVGLRLCRDRRAEELLLFGAVVLRVAKQALERAGGVFIAIQRAVEEAAVVRPVGAGPAPAGEHPRHAVDVGMAIGRDRLATGLLPAAVGVQFVQADRHQLHHLSREVFIGHAAAFRVGLLVADGGQVGGHHRVHGHRFQQLAVVAQALVGQHVEVAGHGARVVAHRAVLHRDHEDLRQGKGHALTQLVIAADGLLPEGVDRAVLGDAAPQINGLRSGIGHLPGAACR